jgi:hypothetical protein
MPWSRLLRALMVAYVAATAIHIAFVMAHEPFAFDAWNVAVDTNARPFTVGRFFDYWWFEYTHSNPRLGQAFTYLAYKLDGFAELATPLAYLALTLAVTTLGLGRVPWKRGRDLAAWAIAIGFGWFVFPEIGRNMFCRAYSANYIYGAAIQLWFLVPLRLARTYQPSTRTCVAYGVLGFVAGICNEHTGPTFIALLAAYAWWSRRRGKRVPLVWAGAIGFAIGFAALFFAPGQNERYDELATKVSLPMRMIQRGVVGNVDILRDYVLYAAPLLCLVVILLVIAQLRGPADDDRQGERRTALRLVVLALVAGLLLAMTMFVSPKLGARFYIVSMALLLASVLALVDVVLVRPRQLVLLVLLAVAASIYAAARTVPLYLKVSREGAIRMTALDHSKPGSIFVADAFEQVDETWWYIGDDFRDAKKRELVARYFDLARVFFRGYEQKAPLGMAGIRVVPRYWLAGESCAAEDDAFDLSGTKGFEIAAIHATTRTSIELLQRRIPPGSRLDRFELGIEFMGEPPPLPRPKLVLARWHDARLEGYTGAIVRHGNATTRDIKLDPQLVGKPFQIYIAQIGSEARRLGGTNGEPLQYTPWRTGVYWVLACDDAECWVIAAARNNG